MLLSTEAELCTQGESKRNKEGEQPKSTPQQPSQKNGNTGATAYAVFATMALALVPEQRKGQGPGLVPALLSGTQSKEAQ